jgi:hypothetical protein
MRQALLVLGGAAAGGLLGYVACIWLAGQGLYMVVLPGGLLGIGAGLARNRSVALAVICGLLATGLGVFTTWRVAPFAKDESLSFFIQHIRHVEPVMLVMIALGGLVGFWVPFRRKADGP